MNLPAPAEVKRYLLARALVENGIRTFVETGTFYGDTIASVLPYVDKAITIEVDRALFMNASNRFSMNPKVDVHHADSGDRLADLVKVTGAFEIPRPALFWLDAHWMGPERRNPDFGMTGIPPEPNFSTMDRAESGDTPIEKELISILDRNCPEDIIVIDDARYFGFVPSYPRVEWIFREVASRFGSCGPEFSVDVVLDMIWIARHGTHAPTQGMRYGDAGEWGCPLIEGLDVAALVGRKP